jgi:glycosyltransferase involved in cell wall biosynthesis
LLAFAAAKKQINGCLILKEAFPVLQVKNWFKSAYALKRITSATEIINTVFLRVALFTDGLFPDVVGGMQKHSFYLAKYFAMNGLQVDLYYMAPSKTHDKAIKAFAPEIAHHIHPIFVPFLKRLPLPGHYIMESRAFSIALYHQMTKRPPVDFIYAQGFTGWMAAEMSMKGKLKTPLFVNLHGLEMFQPVFGFKAKLQQKMLQGPAKFILKNADFAYSLGGRLTDILKQLTTPKKIIVQSIGLDKNWMSDSIPQTKTPRQFVFVGRPEKRKGMDLLSELMQKADSNTAHFHIVGNWNSSERIKGNQVTYHGLIKEESKLQQILDNAQVLICPSYSEGMPTVILEAMSRGLAVIATDVGAVCELVSSKTGWLISPGKSDELLTAYNEALTGVGLEEKQRNAQALISSKFTWDKVIANTIADIEKVLKPALSEVSTKNE